MWPWSPPSVPPNPNPRYVALVSPKQALHKSHREIVHSALTRPGPDLIVADEAHVLGNLKSQVYTYVC